LTGVFLGSNERAFVLCRDGAADVSDPLSKEFFVDAGFADEHVREQATVAVVVRFAEFEANFFAADERVVCLRGFFGADIALFGCVNAEVSDATVVVEFARVAVEDLENGGGVAGEG
jgi:hypothetical protein